MRCRGGRIAFPRHSLHASLYQAMHVCLVAWLHSSGYCPLLTFMPLLTLSKQSAFKPKSISTLNSLPPAPTASTHHLLNMPPNRKRPKPPISNIAIAIAYTLAVLAVPASVLAIERAAQYFGSPSRPQGMAGRTIGLQTERCTVMECLPGNMTTRSLAVLWPKEA